jgi:hypothetical protein
MKHYDPIALGDDFLLGCWVKKRNGSTADLDFKGPRKPLYVVVRDRVTGVAPKGAEAPLEAKKKGAAWALKLPSLDFASGNEGLLYFFSDRKAAEKYMGEWKTWTAEQLAELLPLLDSKLLPDVNLLPSIPVAPDLTFAAVQIRKKGKARESRGIQPPSIQTGLLPIFNGGSTVQLAAPGAPPGWIPPY